jgi:hypothetical protein
MLVKSNLPSSKRKHSESAVSLSDSTSISDQESTSNQPKTAQIVASKKQTETKPSANSLFQTADIRWTQPIFEEPFAKFHDWAERYIAASAQEKLSAEAEGVELSRLRRTAMVDLIRDDPERALQLSVPVQVVRQLPVSIRRQLEERVSGRGRLAVFGALPAPGKEKDFQSTFRTATLGESEYDAFVYGRRLGEPTRENIPISGIALDKSIAVSEDPLRILEPEEALISKSSDPICAVSRRSADEKNQRMAADIGGRIVFLCGAAHAVELNDILIAQEGGQMAVSDDQIVEASLWTEGLKSLILIRVDFPDLPGAPFQDSTGIALISNVNSFYAEMSYGRAGIVAFGDGSDITPTFRLSQPAAYYGTNGNYNKLRTEARTAAATAGYDVASYDRDLICFGAVPNLNWSGLAFVGASGVWLHNNFSTGVTAHELGHNLGLNHANFWDTSGQSVIGPGSNIEYGDLYDTMGASTGSSKHFNVRNKAYLNWLKTNEWINVTTNGRYRIFAHDSSDATGLRGLRIVKNSNTNYWLEFRQKISNKWLLAGAGLRRAQNGNQQSQLLDTTPGSLNGKNDSCIAIGATFSDRIAGIHITPVAKGGTVPESLDVVVNIGLFLSNQPPVLHLNASSTAAAPNDLLNFSAVAQDFEGDALAYYWDFGDNSFGANAPAVLKSWDSPGEYVVRCTVSDMKGGVASESKIITIGTPSTYRISGTVTSSSGPLQGVRVYVSGTQMAYADTDGSYSIVGLPAGSYTVRASFENYTITNLYFANPVVVGPSASDVSFVANYSDLSAPSIITQPFSQTAIIGSNATFSVSAIGTARLYYQWRFNGASITGATNSTYTRINVQIPDAGNYSVVVTNATGTATSANAVLTVNLSPMHRIMLDGLSFLPNGQPQFTVTGFPNERYIIEFSSNLVDWVEGSAITNFTGIVQYTDTQAVPDQLQRFYRLKLAR